MADPTSPEPRDPAASIAHAEQAAVVRHAPAPSRRPLPDAVGIHVVVVPDGAPPYDDARQGAQGDRPPGQTPPAARQHQPAAISDAADVKRAVAAMADASHASAGFPGQGQFSGHWPSQFAQVLAETLAGSRPPSQLGPWTTQQTRRRIGQLGQVLSAAQRPRVKRVIITSPTGGVLEMAVIVGVGTRVRALAVRLERTPTAPSGDSSAGRADQAEHPGWICTAIEAA